MVDQNQQRHSSPNVKKEARDPARATASGSKPKKPRVSTGPSASTPADSGVGHHFHTQLIYAVSYLKDKNAPTRLEDLAVHSRVEALLTNDELLAALKAHDKVRFDEKTELFSYKPDYDLRSNDDLLTLLRKYSPRGGMAVKKLQESWPNARTAIEELEAEGKVLVLRTGGNSEREGQMKTVFWDAFGRQPPIDSEFHKMWHSLKVPDAVTIGRQLEEAGMKTTATINPEPSVVGDKKKNKKKKGSSRGIKIQNTHLKELGIDLSKDFVKPTTSGAPSAKT